ncbi:MAG: hypothetical protein AAB965_03775 [Patescibacteria group bacterium]
MTRTEVEVRIRAAIEAAGSDSEARRFIEESFSGEPIVQMNLVVTWLCDGYKCVDFCWTDVEGSRQSVIVDNQVCDAKHLN